MIKMDSFLVLLFSILIFMMVITTNAILQSLKYPQNLFDFNEKLLIESSYLTEVDHFRPQDNRYARFVSIKQLVLFLYHNCIDGRYID